MASSEEIFEKVQETLIDALGVDDDEVTSEATLIGDLGAESMTFLTLFSDSKRTLTSKFLAVNFSLKILQLQIRAS